MTVSAYQVYKAADIKWTYTSDTMSVFVKESSLLVHINLLYHSCCLPLAKHCMDPYKTQEAQ